MPVLHLTASSPDGRHTTKTAALLDNCSNRTFCTPGLLERLHVQTTPAQMQLDLAGRPGHRIDARVAAITVTSADGRNSLRLPRVHGIDGLPTGVEYATRGDTRDLPHLRDLPLPERRDRPVEILIGVDAHHALRPISLETEWGDPRPHRPKRLALRAHRREPRRRHDETRGARGPGRAAMAART